MPFDGLFASLLQSAIFVMPLGAGACRARGPARRPPRLHLLTCVGWVLTLA